MGERDSAATIGATAPIDNFGFIDLEAVIIFDFEARRRSNGAIDVEDQAAAATHQVVVIVTDAILEPRWRPGGLDSTNECLVGEDAKRVIDRLPRNRSDVVANDFGQFFCCGMRASGNGLHDC